MLPQAAFFPRKPPQRRKRENDSAPPAPPVAPLEVVGVGGVEFDGEAGLMFVTFNTSASEPLNPTAGADPTKWTARFDGAMYTALNVANVSFDTIQLAFGLATADAGADELSYSNAPSDIGDSLGRALAAFSGFPI
jgi:hypothetical protein